MSLEVEMIAPGGVITDISTRVRLSDARTDGVRLTSQCEEGAVGSSELVVDDKLADLYIRGGHSVRARETASESDDPYLFSGAFASRKIIRGRYRTGVKRLWRTTVVDGNSAIARMVFRPSENAKRPAETCGARGAWLLTTIPMSNLTDHRYFDTTDPTPLDEADYTRQSPTQVLDDMAQQSGFDFGVIYAGDTEEYAPVYMAPDSDLLDSPLRLTNLSSDVTGDVTGNTAYLNLEADMDISDERLASGIFGEGDGIEVFQQRTATATEFGRRDKVMSAPNVKTLPKLKARVNRWLSDFDDEEVTINAVVQLPAEKVTLLKAQYRVQVRAAHWGEHAGDWVWCRVLSATYEQKSGADYLVTVELALPKVASTSSTYSILYGSQGPFNGNEIWWWGSGDEPIQGAPGLPTLGLIEPLLPDDTPTERERISGFKVLGTGTIDLSLGISAVGVSLSSHVITVDIRVNGVSIASEASSVTGFKFWGYDYHIVATGVDVVPDDVITATIVAVPNFGIKVPGGTGGAGEQFIVTGGSLS